MKKQKYKGDNFSAEVFYSKEAKKEKLIKFTIKEGQEFEISVNEIVALLTKDFSSDISAEDWVKIYDTKVTSFPMLEVVRNVQFQAAEDIKKGAMANVSFKQHLPFTMALMEETVNNQISVNKDKVRDVTVEDLKEYFKSLPEEVIANHKRMFTKEIGEI